MTLDAPAYRNPCTSPTQSSPGGTSARAPAPTPVWHALNTSRRAFSVSPKTSWTSSRPSSPPPARSSTNENSGLFLLRTPRSEEHTSELQSRLHLVCRLLLEKKKKKMKQRYHSQRD